MSLNTKIFAAAAVVGVASAMSAMPAQAATFDFTGPLVPNVFASYSDVQDGITLSATAQRGNNAASIVQGLQGFGVVGSLFNPGLPGQIDGTVRTLDRLNLTFSKAVKILSVTFGRVGSNDSFRLTTPGGFSTSGLLTGNSLDLGSDTETFSTPFSTAFSFSVPTTIAGAGLEGSDYTVQSLTVQAIPTPALLPGLAAMGVAALRKRKREATAQTEA